MEQEKSMAVEPLSGAFQRDNLDLLSRCTVVNNLYFLLIALHDWKREAQALLRSIDQRPIVCFSFARLKRVEQKLPFFFPLLLSFVLSYVIFV